MPFGKQNDVEKKNQEEFKKEFKDPGLDRPQPFTTENHILSGDPGTKETNDMPNESGETHAQPPLNEDDGITSSLDLSDQEKVEPGDLDDKASPVDPDLPETEGEDDEDDEDETDHDPLSVVLLLNHAKELVDFLRARGYIGLSEAFLAVEAGESITIRVEV